MYKEAVSCYHLPTSVSEELIKRTENNTPASQSCYLSGSAQLFSPRGDFEGSQYTFSESTPNGYSTAETVENGGYFTPSQMISETTFEEEPPSFIKPETDIKKIIQEMQAEDLRETVFQFLNANPKLVPKFKKFVDMEKPYYFRENWKAIDGFRGRDWSGEFTNSLQDRQLNSRIWQEKMYSLSNDFFHAASLYAQVIISELTLPVSLKSIQPVNVGGVAGGDKYICDNILFKLAVDAPIRNNGKNTIYMYGGSAPRNDLSMKAAGIEMTNMNVILAARPEGLFPPLMCVIDYLGHRIIASSILPIDGTTLCYGSADGGHTLFTSNTELNDKIATLGRRLNLAEHLSGSRRTAKSIHMPGDIEAHKGRDDRYYIIDFARVMPPEAPKRGNRELNESRKVYYQMLRPELVAGHSEPLSSDAYSGWCEFDNKRKEHNRAVRECTDYLKNTIIPMFAEKLEKDQLDEIACLPTSKAEWEATPQCHLVNLLECSDMSNVVHYYGINVRHLGMIRSHMQVKGYRDFFLAYCIARTMKNILRNDMRNLMAEISKGSPTDIPLRDLVLSTYKNIHPFFSLDNKNQTAKRVTDDTCGGACIDMNRIQIDEYWNNVHVQAKIQYPDIFSEEEESVIHAIGLHDFVHNEVDFRVVLYLFFKFAQVQLSASAMEQLLAPSLIDKNVFVLVRADVASFAPRTRIPYIASLATSLLLANEAKQPFGAENALRLLDLATKNCYEAHIATPLCPKVNKQLGLMYYEKGNLQPGKSCIVSYFRAVRHVEMALSIDFSESLKAMFRTILMKLKAACHEQNICVSHIESLLSRKWDKQQARCVETKLTRTAIPHVVDHDYDQQQLPASV